MHSLITYLLCTLHVRDNYLHLDIYEIWKTVYIGNKTEAQVKEMEKGHEAKFQFNRGDEEEMNKI